ncbi:RebB family R body protein [uncultured Shewanella sp.]|uniref:RebB family R body protein n=1 Tax=uncultured Shewanella sp. TaxID=173975 RepID=UPI002622282E|nr:RebB family R body protein [uncultured Shewanella sp.]
MSAVNDQVTDAVTQLNTLLTGGAVPQSMGMLDIAGAETLGMSMFNAITAQQNAQTSSSAAITASCAKMLKTEVPSAEKNSKSALLQLALAEQKLAITLAAYALYELYKKNNANATIATATLALDNALSAAEKALTPTKIEKTLLDGALGLLKQDITDTLKAVSTKKKS